MVIYCTSHIVINNVITYKVFYKQGKTNLKGLSKEGK